MCIYIEWKILFQEIIFSLLFHSGNIPMNWYDEYPHMGYDLDGNPIIKPDKGDKLDQFLRMLEDPDHGWVSAVNVWVVVLKTSTGNDAMTSLLHAVDQEDKPLLFLFWQDIAWTGSLLHIKSHALSC